MSYMALLSYSVQTHLLGAESAIETPLRYRGYPQVKEKRTRSRLYRGMGDSTGIDFGVEGNA